MLWDSALDGIALLDLPFPPGKGGIINVNDYACRALDYSREELLRPSLFDLVDDEGKQLLPERAARVVRSGSMLFELTVVARDGRRIPAEVNASLVHFAGRPVALVIVRDMTERRRMEDMLRQMNDRLEEEVQTRTSELNHTIDRLQKLTLELAQAEDRERKRLAEFLHDDLQQMLAAVKFQVSILAGRVQGDAALQESIRYTKQILKDAIEKSRNLSHELSPPVLAQGSLEDLCRCLASQMESQHGLAVQVEIRGGACSDSAVVRSFLYRAVQELLFNVVKHARVGEAKLRLQRVRNELWLTISDKGGGFETASLDKVAGYGLMSIRERAELLGGRLKVKSIPGRGSIFFVAIPDAGP